MYVESDRDATDSNQRVAFRDHAPGVTGDRTYARVALSCHGAAMHSGGAGSGDHFASMACRVAQSNHALHVFSFRKSDRASYRSDFQRQTV
jgi:hypothetical protein